MPFHKSFFLTEFLRQLWTLLKNLIEIKNSSILTIYKKWILGFVNLILSNS